MTFGDWLDYYRLLGLHGDFFAQAAMGADISAA